MHKLLLVALTICCALPAQAEEAFPCRRRSEEPSAKQPTQEKVFWA